MKGIHIILDGNNTAIRNNSVMDISTKAGERTAAIYGCLNTAHSAIEYLSDKFRLPVKQVIFLWDRGHSSRRKQLYPEYKAAKRSDWSPESEDWFRNLFMQIDELHIGLPYFGIKSFFKKGYEGDDLIYGTTEEIHSISPNDICIIISTDEDYHQLISEYVNIFNPTKKFLITPNNYKEFMGIEVSDYILYKSLKGDHSDNIPGIKGIGEKTAKSLVSKYHSLEGLIEHEKELSTRKTTAKIFTEEGLNIINRNDQLMNLKKYVDLSPIQSELHDLVTSIPSINNENAKEFLKKWQFVSILYKYKEWILTLEDVTINFNIKN